MFWFYLFSFALANPINAPTNLPKFSTSQKYFLQSNPSNSNNITNFGLNNSYTWTSILQEIGQIPNTKLFLIQRHGQGYHNIAPAMFNESEWDCYWQFESGGKGLIWEDAELTIFGIDQIKQLSININNTVDFPKAQAFFVSPLRRTLQTWQLTWQNLTNDTAVIKELARETYGLDSESKRHNKTYIASAFPGFRFEPGFNETDGLWGPQYRENSQQRKLRAGILLDDIFNSTDGRVINLVSHSGLISSILEVIGHRSWGLDTGELIPVIITRDQNFRIDYKLDLPWRTFRDLCSFDNYSDPLAPPQNSTNATTAETATSKTNSNQGNSVAIFYNWIFLLPLII